MEREKTIPVTADMGEKGSFPEAPESVAVYSYEELEERIRRAESEDNAGLGYICTPEAFMKELRERHGL